MTSRTNVTAVFVLCVLLAAGCGGGGGSSHSTGPAPSSANVIPFTVGSGPYGNYLDGSFASVTICAPGTLSCQTIGGLLIDTGSYGLRIFASQISVALNPQNTSTGQIGECALFGSGATWGPVEAADVKLGGEPAVTVPIQVISPNGFASAPGTCTQNGPMMSNPSQMGFNGILGVGLFRHDCGTACSSSSSNGTYFSCNQQGCTSVMEPLSSQVQNPVWLLPADNNGLLLDLPQVNAGGSPSVSGSLVLGIGTESNNSLGAATVYTADSAGNFTTTYNGSALSNSFIDSGSNGYFFNDSSIPQCPASSAAPDYYCPPSTLALSADNTGQNGTTGTIAFQIANADSLFSAGAGNNAAFSNIGGPLSGFSGAFDWGLPFFFGRTVFVGIEGQSSPGGIGPYWAY